MAFFWDFPIPPEGHPDSRIVRSYISGGYQLPEPTNQSKNNNSEASVAAH
jgi:hypothetical protein